MPLPPDAIPLGGPGLPPDAIPLEPSATPQKPLTFWNPTRFKTPGDYLGDIEAPGGITLPNLPGAAVRAAGGAIRGLLGLPFLLGRAVTAPIQTAQDIGAGVKESPARFLDFLKTAGPTEMAGAFAEPLAGAALTGGLSTAARAGGRALAVRAPGASVAMNAEAARRMPGIANVIRPEDAPPVSSLYGAAEAAPGFAEASVPVPNLTRAAGQVSEQYGRRWPGLAQGPAPKTAEAIQTLGGSTDLPTLLENLKAINEQIGVARAAGGENLGAWRNMLAGLHQDFRAVAASGNPAAQGAAEAVRQANLQFLADDLRDLIRKTGISAARSDALVKAQPARVLEALRKDVQFRADLERAAPGALAEVERRLGELVPLAEKALPPVPGAQYGSGRRLGAAAAGGLAGGPTGALIGAELPGALRWLFGSTRPGQAAVRWGMTPTPPAGGPSITLGAGAGGSDLLQRLLGGP